MMAREPARIISGGGEITSRGLAWRPDGDEIGSRP